MNLWDDALNGLSEKMIEEHIRADMAAKKADGAASRKPLRWIMITAAALLLAAGLGLGLSGQFRREIVPAGPGEASTLPAASSVVPSPNEDIVERAYRTRITEGPYREYASARVCAREHVGTPIGSVLVEAGWQNADGRFLSEPELLNAQVFALRDISSDTAVCLLFTDKGDALTTDHYYVYTAPGLSDETLSALCACLGWPSLPDPGPADNGLVTVTTAAAPE